MARFVVHPTDSLRRGDAFAPLHRTAQVSCAGRIDAAVNRVVDPVSGQPELEHTPVESRRRDMRWHGTILARRAVMLLQISCWARIRGAGYHACVVAGGATSPASVGAKTHAGASCGSCRLEIRALPGAARDVKAT